MLFNAGEKVLCFHVGLLYEAKVLQAEKWTGEENITGATGPHYKVHYMGWRARWDEWVPESRMLKLNEENLGKQKALLDSVKAAQEVKSNNEGAGSSKTTNATASRGGEDNVSDRRKSKESRGTKRGRESAVEQEDEYIKRPEIKLSIPDSLRVRLVDDWEFVTKRNQLVPLPRSPNVAEIIDAYKASYLENRKAGKSSDAKSLAIIDEILLGLQIYFDKALGNNLLYRFERTQYVQQRKAWTVQQAKAGAKAKESEMQPSKVYGAEHLLRLFVNLPSIIAHTTMDGESIVLLREHLLGFLQYMSREEKQLFVNEYETPSASYHRLSWT